MNIYNSENHAQNLPDAFRKDNESNNYKILEIEHAEGVKFRNSLREIESILSIDNARGKTLDLYGAMVGQARGLATDEQYLVMIKAKMVRNLSNGSLPSILNALSVTLGCEKTEIQIKESENAGEVELVTLPLEIINQSGFTATQITAIIQSLLPTGICAVNLNYDGTFEFSDNESEYDEETGFCDVEGGEIGGYLGYTAGDKNEPVLPI